MTVEADGPFTAEMRERLNEELERQRRASLPFGLPFRYARNYHDLEPETKQMMMDIQDRALANVKRDRQRTDEMYRMRTQIERHLEGIAHPREDGEMLNAEQAWTALIGLSVAALAIVFVISCLALSLI